MLRFLLQMFVLLSIGVINQIKYFAHLNGSEHNEMVEGATLLPKNANNRV